jgi:hypothetical protein
MGFMGVIERLAVDVLCVLGQMVAHRRRQILVGSIGHRSLLSSAGRLRAAILFRPSTRRVEVTQL